jgi:DNA-binding transcriptional LysR family regulator
VLYNSKTGDYEDVELRKKTCTSDALLNLKLLAGGDHIVFAFENTFLDSIPKDKKVVKILTHYKMDPQIFYLIRPTKETDLRVNLFIDFLKQCFNPEDLAK